MIRSRSSNVSMREIASLCQVSEATVSKALSGRGSVAAETRDRILETASRFDYRPNALVRQLQSGRTMTVAIAGNHAEDPFQGHVLAGIMHTLHLERYETLIFSWDESVRDGVSVLRTLAERRIDGLIMFPPAEEPDARYMHELRTFGGAVVTIDQHFGGGEFDLVATEDHGGSASAVDHLVSLGHERIACFALRTISSGQARYTGYLERMAHHRNRPIEPASTLVDASFEEAHAIALDFLASGTPADRPTAIVCFNDVVALGVCAAAHDLGLMIPRDLSVVGFADLPLAAQIRPALTTVRQDMAAIGSTAAQLMLERLAERHSGASTPHPPHRKVLPTRLILRGTTAEPRASPDILKETP